MQIRKIMTKNPACCTPDSTLQEVAHMMEMYDCGCIPVIDNHQEKRPVGTITDRDITVRALSANRNPLEMKASDIMTTDLVTVTPETSFDDCLKVMEDKQIRRVLVVDKSGKCIGIVAQADLAEHETTSSKTANFVREVSESESDRANDYGNSSRRNDYSFSQNESTFGSRQTPRKVYVEKKSFFNGTTLLTLLGSIGLGAGLKYYLGLESENKHRPLSTGEIEAARRDIKNTAPQKKSESHVSTTSSTVHSTASITPSTDATEIRDAFGVGINSFDKANDDSDLKPITELGRTATNT